MMKILIAVDSFKGSLSSIEFGKLAKKLPRKGKVKYLWSIGSSISL